MKSHAETTGKTSTCGTVVLTEVSKEIVSYMMLDCLHQVVGTMLKQLAYFKSFTVISTTPL